MPSHTPYTHLRLERPVAGRRPARPGQPGPAQRDVGGDDRLLGRRDRRARRRPLRAGGGGDRGGQRLLLGRQHQLAGRGTRHHRRRAAHQDARLLPGVAVDPTPGGAHDRRAQRGRGRRRPVPAAGLRPALRDADGQARRAVPQARPAPGHGRHLLAARTSSGPPPHATCSSPGDWSRARRRCGWAWSRGSSSPRVSSTRCSRSPPGSPPTHRSRPGSPRSRWPTAGTPTSTPPCSGRRWRSRSRWPPRTCRRGSAASQEKRPAVFHGR